MTGGPAVFLDRDGIINRAILRDPIRLPDWTSSRSLPARFLPCHSWPLPDMF